MNSVSDMRSYMRSSVCPHCGIKCMPAAHCPCRSKRTCESRSVEKPLTQEEVYKQIEEIFAATKRATK